MTKKTHHISSPVVFIYVYVYVKHLSEFSGGITHTDFLCVVIYKTRN